MQLIEKKLPIPSQLQSILNDIRSCIANKLYYPALLIALTLPEICSALEVDDSVFIKEKQYAAFVDKYAPLEVLNISGQNCYRLRGGVVHRGNAAGHPHIGASHVIFYVPESPSLIHGISVEVNGKRAANFDLIRFCEGMISAVEKWFVDHKDKSMVNQNIPRLLSLRLNGIAPFVTGGPVVGSGEDGFGPSAFMFGK